MEDDCKCKCNVNVNNLLAISIVGWGRGGEGGCCITAVGRGAKTGVTCRGVRDWQGGDIGFTEVEHRERGGGSVTRGRELRRPCHAKGCRRTSKPIIATIKPNFRRPAPLTDQREIRGVSLLASLLACVHTYTWLHAVSLQGNKW